MLRNAIVKSARPLATRRFISTTPALMKEGATGSGASRAGGAASGDAFTKREAASEEMYIKQEERNKLLELRKKLQEQREHIERAEKDLDNTIKKLSKDDK